MHPKLKLNGVGFMRTFQGSKTFYKCLQMLLLMQFYAYKYISIYHIFIWTVKNSVNPCKLSFSKYTDLHFPDMVFYLNNNETIRIKIMIIIWTISFLFISEQQMDKVTSWAPVRAKNGILKHHNKMSIQGKLLFCFNNWLSNIDTL